LPPRELELLRPLLASAPVVVHLQSGHGLDDLDLVAAGTRRAVGIDFSEVAAAAAQRRALGLAVRCRYVVAQVPAVPLRDQCADLVYTGKGALIWMPDLDSWARTVARLLRPAGHLLIYEAHPMVPLWTWDEDKTAVIAAGLEIRHVAEHPEPFWQRHGVTAAAWHDRLPNTYSLLAQRR
jgi:ubiquinone/menaquinone biosynthesis C-methylase UbiE